MDPQEQYRHQLERRIAALEGRFPHALAGGLPNSLQVASLGIGPTAKSAMWINMQGNTPGASPYWSVTDAAGIVRVEGGNLAANGISPAQEGLRVNDENHNPIFDSLGLIATMQSPGFAAAGSSQVVGAGAGWIDLTSSSFTMTISRAVRILYMVFVTGYLTAAGGGNFTQVRGEIVGFDNTASIYMGTSNITSSFIWYFTGPGGTFTTIPAGTYTVKMQANATGSNFNVSQLFHQVFVLGS